MADMNDLFFFGDDFDAILGILEEEEELDGHFAEAADNVQLENVVCQLCNKKCKSKSGLKRHITAKHKENTRKDSEKENQGERPRELTIEVYSRIVDKAKAKIIDNKVYPHVIRDEIKSYSVNNSLRDISPEFSEIQNLYKRLVKSGNAERFYAAFYSTIALHSVKYFEGLPRNAATLLPTKVADCMLAHSRDKVEAQAFASTKLSEEEKAGLQYIGGYVLHKLHNKHVSAKKSLECEQAISLLKAGRLENQAATEQQLTASLNRGGLWAITRKAQSIFERSEHYFREATSNTDLRVIPIASIISRSICDVEVVAAYNSMLSDSELMIDSKVAKDILHNIILLYVRVRSFSFAKDIIQKHKIKLKQLKSKALRKEISRSSTENDQERQN